jgi:hypothetical protein
MPISSSLHDHSVTRRALCLISALACAVMLVTCGPKPKVVVTPPVVDTTPKSTVTPTDLSVDVSSGKLTAAWKKQGTGLIGGYNIYISQTPLDGHYPDSVKPFNTSPYPGDTNPEDSLETFNAEGLTDGVKYFVSVRVLYPDGTSSAPSNEVVAICGFRGEIELAVRFSGENDGFCFGAGKAVRADDPANDLYLFTKDKTDYLASPSRLGGFLRESRMVQLSVMGRFIQLRESIQKLSATPTEEKVAVKPGHWILIRTADSTHALVQVLGVVNSGKDRKLKLFIAHCPAKGEMVF